MTDKAISDLTEIFAIGDDDYLVVETAAGNTRKIKKSNVGVEGRVTPGFIQKATLRGDGTIALPVAPTVGNLMVLVMAGYSSTSLPGTYKPAGFTVINTYFSDANNAVCLAVRRVKSGDTGSYAMSTTDNQSAVLYEFDNAVGAFGLAGGAMSGQFSGASYIIAGPQSPYGVNDIILGAFTQDTTATWTLTAETGLTLEYATPADGQNHTGLFFRYDNTFDGEMAGTTSSNPTSPAFGMFAVVGAPG